MGEMLVKVPEFVYTVVISGGKWYEVVVIYW
jgi:hypothetical protein